MLLLRCEVIEMNAPTTALCYAMSHYSGDSERTIESDLGSNPQFDEQIQIAGLQVPSLLCW